MAENKLKTALREVVSAEFAEIPGNEREINHSFSDDFLRRMDKLTHAQQSRFWRMTNTVPRRVAAVAAAFLLIALTACSIPSVRAAATKFIRETFDSYVYFFTEKSERRQITEYYRLTELPDGYAEEIVVKNDSCCISFYQNEAGDRIIFAQSVTEDFAIDVDNENGKHSQIDLSGTDVSIYESAGVMVAVWLHDQYAFSLTVYGDCGIDLMIKLIDSVQRQ